MTITLIFGAMLAAFAVFFLGTARDHWKNGRKLCAQITGAFGVVMIVLLIGLLFVP